MGCWVIVRVWGVCGDSQFGPLRELVDIPILLLCRIEDLCASSTFMKFQIDLGCLMHKTYVVAFWANSRAD